MLLILICFVFFLGKFFGYGMGYVPTNLSSVLFEALLDSSMDIRLVVELVNFF